MIGCDIARMRSYTCTTNRHALQSSVKQLSGLLGCVPYFPRGQHIIDELQEGLILDFIVCEDEGHTLSLQPSSAIQHLEVINQVGDIVSPTHTHKRTDLYGIIIVLYTDSYMFEYVHKL